MNKIAKIAALLVALATVFSFSQEITGHLDRDSLEWKIGSLESKFETEQSTIKKFVDSLGNVEKKAFQEAQKYYDDLLSHFIPAVNLLVAILVAITAILITLNFRANKNLEKEYEKLKDMDKRFSDFENKSKIQIEEILKEEREKNGNKLNNAYKKIAELYYISARDELPKVNESKDEKDKNEHWLYHFLCLGSFYYALSKMSMFDYNEVYFIRFVKKFTDEYHKCTVMPDIKFFHHFLTFIEYSENIKNGIVLEETKIIYNKMLKIFDYDKIIEYIKNSDFDEEKERIQKLLTLAKHYKDKEYLKIFNLGKLQEGTQKQ